MTPPPEVRQQAGNLILQGSAAELEKQWLAAARLGILGLELLGHERLEDEKLQDEAAARLAELTPGLAQALAEAGQVADVTRQLDAIWAVVRQPGLEPRVYEDALNLADRVSFGKDETYRYHVVRALACLRVGWIDNAEASLQETCTEPPAWASWDETRPRVLIWPVTALVMARLNRPDEARRSLATARRYLDRRGYYADPELLGLINEAEALLVEASQRPGTTPEPADQAPR